MPGVDPALALHRLHVDPMFVPVNPRKRTFNDKKNLTIREEVTNLLKVEAICELQFPSWIVNVIRECKRHISANGQHHLRTSDRRNMEICVDDMLVKRKVRDEHLANLRETFMWLWERRLKLNLQKCSFGVTSGKFLGYMISERGIKPNPDKIKALLEMKPPNIFKDIQKLMGCEAALSRFISKSNERNLPFFKNL
ncbi:hypothetical protein LIER_34562 [Lithospermum erythrorhizon]|uniref:Reverse transcriptase n=1 Tax=Lithospermum erythrorhizon TaxID=34254 RepID=A0AAV3S1Z9_LITER